MFVCLFGFALAQEDGGKQLRNKRKNPLFKTRIGLSPVLGFYNPNKNHTTGPKPKMALNFSVKEEIRLNKHNTDFLLIGAEYMYHGVSFNTYFFYNDSIRLYTPNRLRYEYNLKIHELDFPIQFKHSFKKETNALLSTYAYAGYCYRWIIDSYLTVLENGNDVLTKSEKLKFKSPAFNPVNSSFLNLGIGFQKNEPLRHNALFGEIQFRYGLSPFYFNESFAPTSMFIDDHFLLLTIGFKF